MVPGHSRSNHNVDNDQKPAEVPTANAGFEAQDRKTEAAAEMQCTGALQQAHAAGPAHADTGVRSQGCADVAHISDIAGHDAMNMSFVEAAAERRGRKVATAGSMHASSVSEGQLCSREEDSAADLSGHRCHVQKCGGGLKLDSRSFAQREVQPVVQNVETDGKAPEPSHGLHAWHAVPAAAESDPAAVQADVLFVIPDDVHECDDFETVQLPNTTHINHVETETSGKGPEAICTNARQSQKILEDRDDAIHATVAEVPPLRLALQQKVLEDAVRGAHAQRLCGLNGSAQQGLLDLDERLALRMQEEELARVSKGRAGAAPAHACCCFSCILGANAGVKKMFLVVHCRRACCALWLLDTSILYRIFQPAASLGVVLLMRLVVAPVANDL
jgi:hypothetical protein